MQRQVEPPILLFGSIIAMVALHFLFPALSAIPKPYGYAGVGLILAGMAVNVWADHLFKKAETTIKPSQPPTSLIVGGPFRFSRHPMYLGMTVTLVGVAAVLGSLTPWILVPVFIGAAEKLFIGPEEKAMDAAFGASYRRYRKTVRRWL